MDLGDGRCTHNGKLIEQKSLIKIHHPNVFDAFFYQQTMTHKEDYDDRVFNKFSKTNMYRCMSLLV